MKLDKVTQIYIVFENCEEIQVPISDINYLTVGKLYEDLRISNILRKDKCNLERHMFAESFYITLKDREKYRRILDNDDITQIHLYDDRGNEEWFFVPWGDHEYINEFQKTSVDEGNILIQIEKD